ncbi:unnamed protein product [Laminaria digitata]
MGEVGGVIGLVVAGSPLATNADVINRVAELAGRGQYLFFAPVSRRWRDAWGERPRVTRYATRHSVVSQLR